MKRRCTARRALCGACSAGTKRTWSSSNKGKRFFAHSTCPNERDPKCRHKYYAPFLVHPTVSRHERHLLPNSRLVKWANFSLLYQRQLKRYPWAEPTDLSIQPVPGPTAFISHNAFVSRRDCKNDLPSSAARVPKPPPVQLSSASIFVATTICSRSAQRGIVRAQSRFTVS